MIVRVTWAVSVTRLGDLLHFGQLFKACGNNYFTQIAHIIRQFLLGLEIFHFSSESIFGQLLKTFGDFLLVTLQLSLMKINYNSTTRKKERKTVEDLKWKGKPSFPESRERERASSEKIKFSNLKL